MIFHGTPGSRLWFAEDDQVAHSLGLHLIAPERPGFGLSDPKPNRSILDWTKDVIELAEALALKKFAVLGISGGGAYAAACAYKIPATVTAAALVSSVAPFDKGKTPKAMSRPNKIAFFISRNLPFLLRISYHQQKKLMQKAPDKFIAAVQSQVGHLCEQDRLIMQSKENAEVFYLHLREALAHGVHEAAAEPALLSRSWGFNCADIRIPVQLWHGTADTLAPFEEAQKLAALIPHCSARYIEEAGHFMMADEQIWTDILEDLSKKHAAR